MLDTFRRTIMIATKVGYNLRTKRLQKGRSDNFAYDTRQKSRVRNLPKIADLVSNLWWHCPGSCHSITQLNHTCMQRATVYVTSIRKIRNLLKLTYSCFQKSWPREIFKKNVAQHTFKLYLVQFFVELHDSFFECQLSVNLEVPIT